VLEGHQEVDQFGRIGKVHGEAVNEGRGDVVGGEDIRNGLGDAFRVFCYTSLRLLDCGFI
jgi:hypothetical protein